MEKIKIGIVGFGNLGKGVLKALLNNTDMELIGVFTRRDPKLLDTFGAPCFHINDINNFTDKIDVMILCGGSATDLPKQGPEIAKIFNTIDSFDTHAEIPQYYEMMNNSSLEGKKISIISTGWDPRCIFN